MTDLTTMCQEFRALRDRKDELKVEEKELNKRIKVLAEQELPEYMEENEIDKVTMLGVGTIYLQQKLYASVLKEDRESLYEELRNTGNEDMVVDYVWPNQLTAWCKDEIESGRPVPDQIKTTFISTAMLRRK